jgi:glycosyltransferase involved in cell wall biosynthesis
MLACMAAQTLPREEFEVVIGDDGSTDGSTDGLETADRSVRVCRGRPQNSYAARNRAVAASTGEVLAFCDADCRPEPEWLEAGLAALDSTDIAAGRIRLEKPARLTVWALLDMDLFKNQKRQVLNDVAETANLFMRRDLFERAGGFDDTVAEDGDFDLVERCVAAGARLSYAPAAIVWHPVRTRARPLLRALWVYGSGYGERATRDGRKPEGLMLRSWVPIVQTLRTRRRFGKSLGPDRDWLAENGVHPGLRQTLLALPAIYLLEPYLRDAAHVKGWWVGRRLR